jgi:hypothetical protein
LRTPSGSAEFTRRTGIFQGETIWDEKFGFC